MSEHPKLINPKKGYLVSANNFITSEKVDHGISHAMVFQHRAVRITEMLVEMIESGKKITVEDNISIQLDLLYIQARESLAHMLRCVELGKRSDQDFSLAFSLFRDWDYRFTLESQAATLFAAWEQ